MMYVDFDVIFSLYENIKLYVSQCNGTNMIVLLFFFKEKKEDKYKKRANSTHSQSITYRGRGD